MYDSLVEHLTTRTDMLMTSDGMNPDERRYKQMILFTKNVSPVTL